MPYSQMIYQLSLYYDFVLGSGDET